MTTQHFDQIFNRSIAGLHKLRAEVMNELNIGHFTVDSDQCGVWDGKREDDGSTEERIDAHWQFERAMAYYVQCFGMTVVAGQPLELPA